VGSTNLQKKHVAFCFCSRTLRLIGCGMIYFPHALHDAMLGKQSCGCGCMLSLTAPSQDRNESPQPTTVLRGLGFQETEIECPETGLPLFFNADLIMHGTAERAKKGQKVKQMAHIWVLRRKLGRTQKPVCLQTNQLRRMLVFVLGYCLGCGRFVLRVEFNRDIRKSLCATQLLFCLKRGLVA
jgi:hypothetical protein